MKNKINEISKKSNNFASLLDSPKNWTEDYEHENGNYINTCYRCKETFFGHKRRVVCKECADKLAHEPTDKEMMEILNPNYVY